MPVPAAQDDCCKDAATFDIRVPVRVVHVDILLLRDDENLPEQYRFVKVNDFDGVTVTVRCDSLRLDVVNFENEAPLITKRGALRECERVENDVTPSIL